jgi:hypothetical protein
MSIIQNGMSETAYKNIAEHIPSYMGTVFEEICKQYLWKLNREDKVAVTFMDLGRWWGNDIEKSVMFGYDIKYYFIFSKCGFTLAALKKAGENIRLICFDDMFS